MKKHRKMKRFVILSALVLFCGTLTLSAQENTEKKLSYNIINEYGFYLGGSSWGNNLGFEGVFINSMLFNRTQDLLGIGLGYSADFFAGHGIPMFLNYRHYFDRGRAVKPLVNIAAGSTFIFGANYNLDYEYYENDEPVTTVRKKSGFGLYATVASGFRVKAFTFSAGFYLKSVPSFNYFYMDNYQSTRPANLFNGGVQVKLGFTF